MQQRNRILIVDDLPLNAYFLEELLRDVYHVVTAASGEEALAIAPEFLPDMILLDVMMPGMDGYETCRQLRAIPLLKHTKIMMVSAKTMLNDRLQGYEAGADDYVSKPIEQGEILAKIRVYLRLKSFEEVAELKSRMYALLNHETRTPLHGILLPAQELRTNESLNAEERDMFLEMIEQSATRLQHLFERVDTLSTMKSGLWDFQFIATDVRKVVQSAIDAITARIPACDITLEHDLPEAVFAMLDPHQMSRVIAAMLENAIQFSPLEGRVTVGVRHDNEYCYVTVSDEGDGIDPVFLPHVFEEFGHPDGMHHTKGYGLSLATVRQVMLAHQGTIEVESTKGVGTTFTLRLSITSS